MRQPARVSQLMRSRCRQRHRHIYIPVVGCLASLADVWGNAESIRPLHAAQSAASTRGTGSLQTGQGWLLSTDELARFMVAAWKVRPISAMLRQSKTAVKHMLPGILSLGV